MLVIWTEPEPYGPAFGVARLNHKRRSAIVHGRATDPAAGAPAVVRVAPGPAGRPPAVTDGPTEWAAVEPDVAPGPLAVGWADPSAGPALRTCQTVPGPPCPAQPAASSTTDVTASS